jgi:hypothetical protein
MKETPFGGDLGRELGVEVSPKVEFKGIEGIRSKHLDRQ